MDIIISCQGGDYTTRFFLKLRAAGWNGHWIDAASSLRMKDDCVIILDPVNLDVIKTRWPSPAATGSAATARSA
jgi:aspartate-semialdehyde dehydrogenase